MFKFDQLDSVHIEITSNCQASCPMCIRNVNGSAVNNRYQIRSWKIEEFKLILNNDVLTQLKGITFCGNLGDPIINDDLLQMIDHINLINPEIYVNIHTNGSMRTPQWWKLLASKLPRKHNVIFALDGLSDTHSIYRIGTNFEKIIENASAFISENGNAEWAFITFKHNQHQIDQAKEMSKNLGFNTFQVKNSTRFIGEPRLRVKDKNGNFKYFLEPADNIGLTYVDQSVIDNYKDIVKNSDIDCVVKKNKSVYIDHLGDVYPCCWLGASPFTYHNLDDGVHLIRKEIDKEHLEMINELGGKEYINSITRPLQDIINDNRWQSLWETIWKEKKSIVCARTCGIAEKKFSQPKHQFTNRYNFNE